MKFHFRISFDIDACQAVEIEPNQVSLFLFELTFRKWQLGTKAENLYWAKEKT